MMLEYILRGMSMQSKQEIINQAICETIFGRRIFYNSQLVFSQAKPILQKQHLIYPHPIAYVDAVNKSQNPF
jgi:hypothetical protein